MYGIKDKLVSYRDIPYGIKMYGAPKIIPISKEEFDRRKGELEYVCFDNNCFEMLYIQITGRCNLKCRHCFSAIDNHPLVTEWKIEDAEDLFRQAKEIGVCRVTLSGGEPTVYPELERLLRSMRENELYLADFNTNGYTFSNELLDLFAELEFHPMIKISLDGIGYHDEFRGAKGSEERALNAIKLCCNRKYNVMIQTQLNRQTAATIPAMLDSIEDYGVTEVRLIKTTETPRWVQNGSDDSFTFKEYFREGMKLIKYQIEKGHKTEINLWECVTVSMIPPYDYHFHRVRSCGNGGDEPLCTAYRRRLSVSADGKLYPCMQMQGYLDSLGISYGDLTKNTLKEIINGGDLSKFSSYTVSERTNHNIECLKCEYKDICTGGCPALGMYFSGGDILGLDTSSCDFFKTGIYDEMNEYLKSRSLKNRSANWKNKI